MFTGHALLLSVGIGGMLLFVYFGSLDLLFLVSVLRFLCLKGMGRTAHPQKCSIEMSPRSLLILMYLGAPAVLLHMSDYVFQVAGNACARDRACEVPSTLDLLVVDVLAWFSARL